MPGRSDLVIVLVPVDENGHFRVCLMETNASGGINFQGDDFIVARAATAESAEEYAKGLADILKFRVLRIQDA